MSRGSLVYLDIETVPADARFGSGEPEPPADFPEATPPGRYSRADSIAKWRREHGLAARVAEWARDALSPYRSRIAGAALLRVDGTEQARLAVCEPGEAPSVTLGRIGRMLREESASHIVTWGPFDAAVLRGQLAQWGCSPVVEGYLRGILRLQSNGGRAWTPRAIDASSLCAAKLLDYRSGWALKQVARDLGLSVTAEVGSAEVLEAWCAGDARVIAERAAEDVRLMAAIMECEGVVETLQDIAR